MPTENRVHVVGDTDLGWGFARVVAVDPDTHAPTLLLVQCKACGCASRFAVSEGAGHVMNGFRHADDCQVLAEVVRHAREVRAHEG